MRKKTGKIFVSILCICSVLAATVFYPSAPTSLAEGNAFDASAYEVLTFTDFGYEDGTIIRDTVYGIRSKASLDGVALAGRITTSDGYMRYGGSDADGGVGSWTALHIAVQDGSLFVQDFINGANGSAEFPSSTLKRGEAFHLIFATDNVDGDGDGKKDDLKVQVWINNAYAGTHTFIDTAAKAKANLLISANSGSGAFTIQSEGAVPEGPLEQKKPEELGYQRVTLGDFNIADGTYATRDVMTYGQYTRGTTLNNKYLDVDITLGTNEVNAGGTVLNFAGSQEGGWYGIRVFKTATYLGLVSTVNVSAEKQYPYDELGITDHTAPMNLKLGVKLSGEDVCVDMWVNDVRQKPMTFAGAAAHFGMYAGIYVLNEPSITVSTPSKGESGIVQKTPEQLGFTELGMNQGFKIPDGTYKCTENGKQELVEGTFAKGLNGKYLNVNLQIKGTYSGTYTYKDAEGKEVVAEAGEGGLRYAGREDSWTGIKINVVDGNLVLQDVTTITDRMVITAEDAGVNFAKEKFNLKLGTSIADINGDGAKDLELSVWVNDKYFGTYSYVNVKDEIGNTARIYLAKAGQQFVVETPGKTAVKLKKLNKNFRQMTFANYKIKDGTYACKNGKYAFADGVYGLGMNETVFSGDILFSTAVGADFRFGGQVDGWHGLRFWNRQGKLYMEDVDGYTDTYTFVSAAAGVELEDNMFNLKLSTEYVDSDKDGKKDDVKLGVWFNDVLYQNQYIYLKDYKQYLGRYIGVFSAADTTYIQIKSVKGIKTGVDWSIFGLTDAWRKELKL